MSNKCLVIGSNSFSGSHFVSYLLEQGEEVIGVSRSPEIAEVFLPYKSQNIDRFTFVQADLNKDLKKIRSLVLDLKPDYIVNFAAQAMVAQSWDEPADWYLTNVVSQVRLLEEIRQQSFVKKYVHVSTPEVYGNTEGWIKECKDYRPSTPYAISRACLDQHLHALQNSYGFPVIMTRAANVYGPGQQLFRIVPRAILCALTGQKLVLHGGGLSTRSFIHIRDVCRATFELMVSAQPGEIAHLSTKQIISIRDLVELIAKNTGVDINDFVEIGEERLGKDQTYMLDSTKVRENYNWSDEIGLEKGILETTRWVTDNLTVLNKQPQQYVHKK